MMDSLGYSDLVHPGPDINISKLIAALEWKRKDSFLGRNPAILKNWRARDEAEWHFLKRLRSS